MRSVSTIIVNFRTPDLTLDAVRSVVDEPETLEAIVVENGSGDDSFARLQAFEHPRFRLLRSERNLGFGGGNNLGAREAWGDALYLLNSDAVSAPGTIGRLLSALKPPVGIVAPRILLSDGTEQDDAYGPFPTLARIVRGHHYGGEPVDWLSGVALLMRREDFPGFDERYFMYLEDTKLCWDLRQKGRTVARVPEATVTHLRGASGTSEAQQAQYLESRERFLRDSGAGVLGVAANRFGLAAKRALRRLRGKPA